MENPTIVSASLSDKELQDSINKMVANFDKGLQDMLEHSNEYVGKIQASLQKIGDTNFGATGSNGGGVAKQTKAQEEFTESVKRSTNEIKKHGKESEMTFDQIANALSQARRTVSDFNTKRASGILPSSEDYKRYEQALARIVEYNDKLKQSALAMADANQKAFAFDGKGLVKDFFSVDERLKQLNQHYKEEEKSSQKATAAIKENTQAKKENANVGQPAKSARDSYIAFMQGYKQQAEQIRRLMEEEQKAMQQRRQGVVDGFSKTIEERKARVKELSEEISKLYKERPDGYRDAIKQRTEEMNALKQKIRELTEAQKNLAESPIGASSRYLELEKEYNRIKNIMIDTTNVQRQSTQAQQQQAQTQQQLTQGAKEYSEQVKQIAAEVRQSAQWQKSDKFGFRRGMMNIDGRPYPVSENLDMGIRLEDQIVSILQRANDERQKGVQITQQQAQSSRQVSEEDRKAMEALGWTDSQQKKKYTSPMMNVERISEARGALQSITGMQEAWVDSINKTKSSYYQLSDYVKQLKNELIHLPKGEHDEAVKVLIREIQQAEREMQKFQKTMSRPVSLKDALGGSEKTLDDIAYKMQRLSSYRSGLNVETQTKEITQVNDKYNRLKKRMDEVMQKNQQMIASNTALGRSWNYMKNRLAFYFTVGATTQFIKNLVEVRSQYEMNERALGILINSAERGTQIFNELSQMSLVSPYTLIELSSAAKQLTAYDIAAKDVVDTTRRLADMASAVGVPIERLTYALGQIKAYGYLNSRDQRMFANAGIPLAAELAKYYTEIEGKLVSTGDVYDRIKKKAVDYKDVVQVINRMTDEGGKFFDFQAKMADTLKVRLANLTLAWNNMLNDIGKSEQGVLASFIKGLTVLFRHWKDINSALTSVALAGGLVVALRALNLILVRAGLNWRILSKEMTAAGVAGARTAGIFRGLGSSIAAIAKSSITWWTLLAFAVVDVTRAFLNANEAQEEFNKSIRKGAEENYKNITEYVNSVKDLRKELYEAKPTVVASSTFSDKGQTMQVDYSQNVPVPKDINSDEAKKAWEAMREQIELSSAASDSYIQRLLAIDDISERLRVGFVLLDDLQKANAALKEMGDNTIEIKNNWAAWWNIWLAPTGLKEAAKGAAAVAEEIKKQGEGSSTAAQLNNLYEASFENLKEKVQSSTESLENFIKVQGLASNPTAVEEIYTQWLKKIAADSELDPQASYQLQKSIEDAKAKAMRDALDARIADENAALAVARDENVKKDIDARLKMYKLQRSYYNENLDSSRAEWNDFTNYIKERHISELQQAYNAMSDNGRKTLDTKSKEWNDFVRKMAEVYAKKNGESVDKVFHRLRDWIKSASAWQLFLKITISTEESKSLYETLKAGDDRINQIDTEIERLKKISSLSSNYAQAQADIANLEKERAELKAKDAVSSKEEKANAKAAKSAAAERKKEAAAERKAQREAESELQKALKDEIQLIDKARSTYKTLVKEAVDSQTAISIAVSGWDETIEHINKVLGKYGIGKFDLTKFAGVQNPRAVMDVLQAQLDKLTKSGVAKPSEIKDLQVKLKDLKVDSVTFDQKTIADSLNNKLSVLKDEYELAVTLDADPELGNAYADMMGINMDTLPHTVKEYADRYAQYLNKYLKDNKSTLQFTGDELFRLTKDDIDAFHEQVKAGTLNPEWFDKIKKGYDDISSKRKKDTEDTIKNWDKLLQKYAEYEYKIKEIEKQSNRERKALIDEFGTEEQKARSASLVAKFNTATTTEERLRLKEQLKSVVKELTNGDEAKVNLSVAIDNKEAQETAKLSFEEFQKSATWITALGDVSDMTSKALSYLRESLQDYLRTADKLDGKSVQKLQKAIRNLDKQMKKRNPFKAFSVASIEAKERAEQYNTEIADVQSQIDAYHKREEEGIELTEEQQEEYEQLVEKLRMLKEEQKAVGQIDASAAIKSLQGIISMARQSVTEFQELAQAMGGKGMTDAAKTLNDVVTILEKGGQGAAIGAQIGEGYGAIIGAVVGVLSGLTTTQMDRWTGNKSISRRVDASALEIKRLENAYIDLEEATNRAMGTAVAGAKQAELANKKLQLAELERQLQLEKSRKKKNKDQDKIIDLERQIKELRYEISQGYTDIVNDLLGVSSAADFAENLVSSMIDAFRKGEDYMKTFQESFEEMVDNMIMKSIVAKIVAYYIDDIWDELQKRITERSKEEADDYAEAQRENSEIKDEWSDYDIRKYLYDQLRASMSFDDWKSLYMQYGGKKGLMYGYITDEDVAAYRAMYQSREDAAKAALDAATAINDDDIQWLNTKLDETLPTLGERLKNIIGQYYTFGDKSQKELSALQQGIQGITEDTAGALEAITNGISQQCYLQSDILIQIRDTVQSFDIDIQTATLSQILLQLQSSYQLQQSMLLTMENWTNPSGNAVRVELIS